MWGPERSCKPGRLYRVMYVSSSLTWRTPPDPGPSPCPLWHDLIAWRAITLSCDGIMWTRDGVDGARLTKRILQGASWTQTQDFQRLFVSQTGKPITQAPGPFQSSWSADWPIDSSRCALIHCTGSQLEAPERRQKSNFRFKRVTLKRSTQTRRCHFCCLCNVSLCWYLRASKQFRSVRQVRLVSAKAECPNHPSLGGVASQRGGGQPARGRSASWEGPPRQWRHRNDSIRPIRLTVALA